MRTISLTRTHLLHAPVACAGNLKLQQIKHNQLNIIMEVMYPSFLPRVPHDLAVDYDDEAWLRVKEEEQHERREGMCKSDGFPRPVGVKDIAEQSDTVELGYHSLSSRPLLSPASPPSPLPFSTHTPSITLTLHNNTHPHS
jgi:hypothetical protein